MSLRRSKAERVARLLGEASLVSRGAARAMEQGGRTMKSPGFNPSKDEVIEVQENLRRVFSEADTLLTEIAKMEREPVVRLPMERNFHGEGLGDR